MALKVFEVLLVFCAFVYVCGLSDTKSDVVFLLDDTISMREEIQQVKNNIRRLFLAISNNSQINNFLLITFNDNERFNTRTLNYYEDISMEINVLRAKTRNADEFLEKLDEIKVHDGGLCPELCMLGIKRSVEESIPNSYIYVITDASAKDFQEAKAVEALAQKNSAQINFLLTGFCGNKTDEDYVVYENLAHNTSGEVFYLLKQDVDNVIEYIVHCIKKPKTTLGSIPFDKGISKINMTVDSDMKDFSVSVKCEDSKVEVDLTDPDGNQAPTTTLVNLTSTKIVNVENPEKGTYTATINSEDKGVATFKAETNLDFIYRFSGLNPVSMENANTRPVPGQQSYLYIKPEIKGKFNVKIERILILDMNNNEIQDFTANISNEKDKIYVTPSFETPSDIFQIAIVGVDMDNNERFKRIGGTPVKPQPKPIEKIQYKKPEVRIERAPNINVKYGDPLILECNVKAYPTPTITWEDEESGLALPSSVSIKEIPYEYLSVLKIEKINKISSYKCRAFTNGIDEDSASIKVETSIPHFWNILKYPEDTNVDYEKDGKVYCKIDALPPAQITWYKEDKEIISGIDFDISDDKTTLSVKNMQPELDGQYYCKATNGEKSTSLPFKLSLSGVDRPEIDKLHTVVTVNEGSNTRITCRILRGFPTATITWEFKKNGTKQFVGIPITKEDININVAELADAGVYKCYAKNFVGDDFHEILLDVQYPPVIDKSTSSIIAITGSKVNIQCSIKRGFPKPVITWEYKRKLANEFVDLPEIDQNITIDQVESEFAGTYKCKARNKAGEAFHKIKLIIQNPPTVVVKKPAPVKIGDEVTLSCEVTGEPQPKVKWFKDETFITTNQKYTIFRDNSLRFATSSDDGGNYTCEAKNEHGIDARSVTVTVYGPVKIEVADTKLQPDVGTDVVLECDATGIPNPTIKWTFYSVGPGAVSNILPSADKLLKLNRIQAKDTGYYTCTADNGFDNETVTYEINVKVPVEIERPEQTTFHVVEGDLALRIPCKAKGYPEPAITWKINGMPLIRGIYIYDDPNGTLIILYPDKSREGTYICTAANDIDSAHQAFTVNIAKYPLQGKPTSKILVEEGTTVPIDCSIPHSPEDTVLWYTKGEIIPMEKFEIRNARESFSGIYTCRVSSSLGSHSAHIEIIVGTKPVFVYSKPNENIKPFIYGINSSLECEVMGKPTPTVTWWKDDTKLLQSDILHIIKMSESDIGKKRCVAENDFGSISRTYVIDNTGCKINYAETESYKYHPLPIPREGQLAQYENENGVMIIPVNESVQFVCPNYVRKKGYCEGEKYFIYNDIYGDTFEYEQLKCDTEWKPSTQTLNRPCSSQRGSKLISIGYQSSKSTFVGLYDICFNMKTKKHIFVREILTRYASNINIYKKESFYNEFMSYNYEEMYNCNSDQKADCCFFGKQFVDPRDVPPGLQKATFYDINITPQWNFCGNSQNWLEVENRIRNLVKTVKNNLIVYSGEHEEQFKLYDTNNNFVTVPKYIWKVVILENRHKALAVIMINIPKLTQEDAKTLVFCEDMCHLTDWMKNTEWRNVAKGYVFCCEPRKFAVAISREFEVLFNYNILISKQT